MGAVLLLALLGCEEMVEQDGGTRRSDSAVVRQLRSELAVPEGVQVIRVASPSPNLITYVLRNPGAQEPDTNTLRVASATDPTSSVGQRLRHAPTLRTERPGRSTLR